jgi:hypothetical protein
LLIDYVILGSSSLISRYAGKRSIGHVADACWNWPVRPTSPCYHGQRPPLPRLVWLLSTSIYIFVSRSALLVSFPCVWLIGSRCLSISCPHTLSLPPAHQSDTSGPSWSPSPSVSVLSSYVAVCCVKSSFVVAEYSA